MSFLVSVNKIYEYPIDKSLSSVYMVLGIQFGKVGQVPRNCSPFGSTWMIRPTSLRSTLNPDLLFVYDTVCKLVTGLGSSY